MLLFGLLEARLVVLGSLACLLLVVLLLLLLLLEGHQLMGPGSLLLAELGWTHLARRRRLRLPAEARGCHLLLLVLHWGRLLLDVVLLGLLLGVGVGVVLGWQVAGVR